MRCDVMSVPHHGSVNTLDKNFTDRLDAQVYIFSCDRRQYERQNSESEAKIRNWFYTYRDGAIKLTIGAEEDISVSRFKGR
jgi:beta-lactamase superfamily II metal-dependent hydrolase